MRFPLPARKPDSPPALLIAGISGRALAAAARRAGYRPLVADFFCDTDTVALAERTVVLPGDLQHGIDERFLIETLRRLAGSDAPRYVVLGSGFEHQTKLVDDIARLFPLAGNDAASIRRIKDPQQLAGDCAELGIPHPAFRWDRPPDPASWVTKATGGAGGTHVKSAAGEGPAAGRYFQRFVPGASVSALFIGDGRKARIIGFSRQWTSPAPASPFRYGGAVRMTRFDRGDAAVICKWLSGLTAVAGLLGLCSADLIRTSTGYQLVEINPRPGATLDIFDSPEAPLLEAHLRAARGEPFDLPRFAGSMASQVAYAMRPVTPFPAFVWPDWTADRQSPGTSLAAGDPVCTVFARGPSAAAARAIVRSRAVELRRCWDVCAS
jgi:predicted ATP-grasp superfamily ATP-dependent carboligase